MISPISPRDIISINWVPVHAGCAVTLSLSLDTKNLRFWSKGVPGSLYSSQKNVCVMGIGVEGTQMTWAY